ncbi:hypothetical protein [Bosea sp. AAP35]|uniref:hypothetical protein n=1 Tax=Bosea sp. AAP35 TaxID=1523417 RepID=UPI0006B8EA84|nr:hypothetical protein [Bosea sp. AAP35]
MASIGKLVSAIAEIEGLDEGAVKLIARYAREAGYISQGSYGPGAARMTPRDAAHLLIAVNASALAKDVARTLKDYCGLRWKRQKWLVDDELEDARDDPFKSIFAEGAELARVLEDLILLATPIFQPKSILEEFFLDDRMRMTIEWRRPYPSVSFSVTCIDYPDNEDEKPIHEEIEQGGFFISGPASQPLSDRVDEVSISHRTLIAVGKVLAI